MGRPAVLYISYDGMLEPLGQSQVIAYLERLTDAAAIHLVSYEKPADWAREDRREALSARLSAAGIAWHPLTYHKTPTLPATPIPESNQNSAGRVAGPLSGPPLP